MTEEYRILQEAKIVALQARIDALDFAMEMMTLAKGGNPELFRSDLIATRQTFLQKRLEDIEAVSPIEAAKISAVIGHLDVDQELLDKMRLDIKPKQG